MKKKYGLSFFKRLRIGTRLYLGISVLLAFIVLMVGIINNEVGKLRTEVDNAINVNVEQVNLATLAKQAFTVSYGSANDYLNSGDIKDRTEYENSATELSNYLQALLDTVNEADLLLVREVEDSRQTTTQYDDNLLKQVEISRGVDAIGESTAIAYNIYDELTAAIEAHNEARAQVIESYNDYDEAQKESSQNSYGSIYGGGGGMYGSMQDSYQSYNSYSVVDSFLMSPMYFENSTTVATAITNITDWAQTALDEAQKEVHAAQASIRMISVVLAIIGAVVSILVSFSLARSITKPINLIRTQLEQISLGGGDLTQRLVVNSKDEAGQLAEAFNTFLGTLQVMIQKIIHTSRELAEHSGKVANSSTDVSQAIGQVATTLDQLAEGSSNQSASASDTVNSMNQLQGAIDQIARGAQEQAQAISRTGELVSRMNAMTGKVKESSVLLADVAKSTESAAANGREAVKEVVSGMDRINTATADVANKVGELGTYSDKIGEIIAVIDEIADQTSLLALNAAIEAARAGEHGRGFAVVADEVRNLSERSRKSTKEIGTLIKEIQNSIAGAVNSMSATTSEVNVGSEIASRAQSSLGDILEAVNKTNAEIQKVMEISQNMADGSAEVTEANERAAAVVEENTAASEQMAAGSSQVLTAVEGIAAISEESAASVEEVTASTEQVNHAMKEVAAAAKELTEASNNLKQLVDNFRV